MAEPEINSAAEPQVVPPQDAVETILASAGEAFGSAFVLSILGGVALSIAGSFAGDMVPSLPPGFNAPPAEHDPRWWNTVQGGAFGFFFAIFFIHSLWVGFHGPRVRAEKRIERILSNLRENWFSLIVGNAIGAWVAVLVLGLVPNFSPFQMLWHWVLGIVLPFVRATARLVFGEAHTASLSDWFSWYNANQTKLYFWMLYLAGALDDLGVPNLKALARRAWRQWQRPKPATSPTSPGCN